MVCFQPVLFNWRCRQSHNSQFRGLFAWVVVHFMFNLQSLLPDTELWRTQWNSSRYKTHTFLYPTQLAWPEWRSCRWPWRSLTIVSLQIFWLNSCDKLQIENKMVYNCSPFLHAETSGWRSQYHSGRKPCIYPAPSVPSKNQTKRSYTNWKVFCF